MNTKLNQICHFLVDLKTPNYVRTTIGRAKLVRQNSSATNRCATERLCDKLKCVTTLVRQTSTVRASLALAKGGERKKMSKS